MIPRRSAMMPAPSGRSHRSTRHPLGLSGFTAAVALVAVLAAPLPPAHAAAGVTVTSDLGAGKADLGSSTTVQVQGSGFQSIRGGLGGVYVLFGWVEPESWRPSGGGLVGSDFLYVPDSESKDNQGFQRFIAFPGSDTEAAAQAVMGADGSWTVDLTIPGPTFQAVDRNNAATSVDCRQRQCGIITIGAHGVKNANNETFTPVEFVSPATPGRAVPGAPAVPSGTAAPNTAVAGQLTLGVDSARALAGNALPFTARGFTAGEQVVASLDGGAVAVGPLTAGNGGEVAGVLPLPSDLAAGTHLLTVRGAASGGSVETEITVTANPMTLMPPSAETETPAWLLIVMLFAVVLALALLVANVIVALRRAVRRRRLRRHETAAAGADQAADDTTPAPSFPAPPSSAGLDEDRTMPLPASRVGELSVTSGGQP